MWLVNGLLRKTRLKIHIPSQLWITVDLGLEKEDTPPRLEVMVRSSRGEIQSLMGQLRALNLYYI